ncbi:MAG: hypothetical protein IPL28_02135 [Chloroflexi bacterium]|nr:hypothetical protein [Chloroflexota bacterium]
MIILDENFVESQRQLLQSWRFSFKQIGLDIGREGMKDDEIIPLLQQLKHPTFFTMDADFLNRAYAMLAMALYFLMLPNMNRPSLYGVFCGIKK